MNRRVHGHVGQTGHHGRAVPQGGGHAKHAALRLCGGERLLADHRFTRGQRRHLRAAGQRQVALASRQVQVLVTVDSLQDLVFQRRHGRLVIHHAVIARFVASQ